MPYIDVVQTGTLEIGMDENRNLFIDIPTAKLLNSKIRDAICASLPVDYVYIDDYFRIFSEDHDTTYNGDDDWIFELELKVEVEASTNYYEVTGSIISDDVDNELFTKNFKALPIIGDAINYVHCYIDDLDERNDIDWFEVEQREKDEALDDSWDSANDR